MWYVVVWCRVFNYYYYYYYYYFYFNFIIIIIIVMWRRVFSGWVVCFTPLIAFTRLASTASRLCRQTTFPRYSSHTGWTWTYSADDIRMSKIFISICVCGSVILWVCLHDNLKIILTSLYLVEGLVWWDWPFTWWTAWHCWLGHLTRKNRPQYDQ